MFMGPFDEVTAWSDEHLAGSSRFLYRVWDLAHKLAANEKVVEAGETDGIFELEVDRMSHKTIKKVNEDIESMHFNTAVSALMEYVNFLNTPNNLNRLVKPENAMLAQRTVRTLVLLIAPITPHIAEELWNELGETTSIHASDVWPKYDPELVKDEVVEIAVQVNGKLRATVTMSADATDKEVKSAAEANSTVARYLAGGKVRKVIHVPRKLINFVVT
jgi:leucyl-tRNA synthetase